MRNLGSIRKAVVLSLTLLATTSQVFAASVSLNPAADAFVATGSSGALANNNYGSAGSLALSAAALSKGEFQSVLRFDSSTAKTTFDALYGPGAWTLQSITLQLSASTVNNAIFNANAAGSFNIGWLQNDSWTEGTGTPNAPGASGITYNSLLGTFTTPGADEALGRFSYNGASTGTFTYSLGLSGGFWSDTTAGNLVSLRLTAADNVVSFLSSSVQFGTAANRPLLTITAIPEPSTLSLLALCGGTLALFVRRKSRA